jgi:predicted RNase H-like nuclease
VRYIGIDLAWGSKNTTAAVALEGNPSQGATLIAHADALLTDEDILAFVAGNDSHNGLLIAIDAPTIVPNQTGRRPCEALLSRCMAKAQAGPHPANRTLLSGTDGTVRGERIAAALAQLGFPQTPFLSSLPCDKPPRAAFEVFPHPGHIALFGLERTLKYKAKPRRTAEMRRAEFRRYADFLMTLRDADPPLLLPDGTDFQVGRDTDTLKNPALKRHEDALDALTCAYIALYYHRWGEAKCAVLGDLETGFIVTPVNEAMRICFSQNG